MIPFNKPYMTGRELDYISEAHAGGHLAGDGAFTKRCNAWFEEKLGTVKALLTHSCTAALEMAAILCDLEAGDEVIMPSYTFVSTANAFVLRGAIPVFVDIREDTLNIDENLIEEAITEKTRAIVAVHYAGIACEMDRIMDIANRHGLVVIEDAAQALLSTYGGKFLGTIGHLGCLSFHETKNVISGEGGALLVNDRRFVERAEIVREKGTNRSQFFRGQVDKYTWVDVGSSYLPSELIGAFLYAQLEQCDAIIAKRRGICSRYAQLLSVLEEKGLCRLPQQEPEGIRGNGHMFYLILPHLEIRGSLIRHLKDAGILAVFHYVPLHASPSGKKYARTHGGMDVTESLSDRLVRLPVYFELSEAELLHITDSVKSFFGL
ncbi:MAG: dTDP-4-amino-4,6-dideoxygalactose transaminase [Burkholderiales bacterium]|nr:dTDP-4-amino-4,6-dideoxygalactose transaminase [Burkholderiales bacterium]